MSKKTVIIMRGQSGAGKSTWIKKNLPSDVTVCSADSYFSRSGEYKFNPKLLGRAHGSCKEKFTDALIDGDELIVVDNTNTKRSEMEFYVRNARGYGYKVRFVRLDTPVDVAAQRNVHGVPHASVQAMKDRMQDIPASWGDEEVVSGV